MKRLLDVLVFFFWIIVLGLASVGLAVLMGPRETPEKPIPAGLTKIGYVVTARATHHAYGSFYMISSPVTINHLEMYYDEEGRLFVFPPTNYYPIGGGR